MNPAPHPEVPAAVTLAAGVRWHLRLLGDVVLSGPQGAPQRLPGRAATALLARLALAPDRAQPREVLIELLWPGVALAVGRNRLRQVLSTLKAQLDAPADGGSTPGEVISADRLSLRLAGQQLRCDAVLFEAAARAGRHGEAAALYRGELMPGFYDEWIHGERNRLALLAEALPPAPATPPPPAAPAYPVPVAGPSALNLPHYLTQLHGVDALGARLRADVQAHRLVTLLGPGGFGKTRLAVEVAHSQSHRLAASAAWGLPPTAQGALPQPFDLVAFVPLVACQGAEARPEAVLAALLMALHQDANGQPPLAHLEALLARRRSLLVLDNFEQLVDSCGALVADLLARCPGLHLLVTSRRALGLDGEHLRALPPLPLPADGPGALPQDAAAALNPAVALFADRARAVRADFQLGPHNRAAVVALVRQLQGMPLAIELAASRVRSFSPAALLALLQAGPVRGAGDGADTPALALLARSGPRVGGDARHASMLAVVQWSWRLLSPQAQRLLPRLSVFAGSFSAAAAQALGDAPAVAVALALDELVAHSMLRAEPAAEVLAGMHAGALPQPDDARFVLFGLIREFAASLLPPAAAVALRQRHRRWLAHWFAALPLATPLHLVRPEVPNLAAAVVAAEADNAPEQAARLLLAAQTALSAISLPTRSLAALGRCTDALADPVLRAVCRAALARHWLVAGQAGDAQRLAAQALAELPAAAAHPGLAPLHAPGHARALVLVRVAHVRWRLQRDPAARAWLDEAMLLADAAAAPALQAGIATNLGALLRTTDPAQALALQRRAIALWLAAGDGHGVNVGRCNLALALLQRRSGCAEALALLDQALADTRASGDALQHALASNLQGEALSRLGRWLDAAQAYQACVATAWAAAEPWPLVYGLWNLPRAWAHLRQPEAAARLMGLAEQHAAAAGTLSRADRHDLRRVQRLCRRQAAAADVARWWAEGAALALAQGVRLALEGALPCV
jgi:predicted ATPase